MRNLATRRSISSIRPITISLKPEADELVPIDSTKPRIHIVWEAYQTGCRTTAEVGAITGLTMKLCSAYTSDLVRLGKLVDKGFAVHDPRRHWYEPAREEDKRPPK